MHLRLLLVAAVAAATGAVARQSSLTPEGQGQLHYTSNLNSIQKTTPGTGCAALVECGSCTKVNFCMWHKQKGSCHAESQVADNEKYSFFQHHCGETAGDFVGADLDDHAMTEHPFMMQPPNIANEDEAHIFQGAWPKRDYGLGELGYQLYGKHAYGSDVGQENRYNPRNPCPNQPLEGCLEKPVIVPRGAVGGWPQAVAPVIDSEVKKGKPAKFRQIQDTSNWDAPKYEDQYNTKDDLE